MKIRELADYCIKIKIDCDKCENEGYCNTMQYRINQISPYGLVEIVDSNIDLLES
jgi:hypothetical protein